MKPLKNVLMINGITSGATGVLLMAVPSGIADLFASDSPSVFFATGAFLVLFAILVLSQAIASSPKERMVRVITVLDVSWVVASLAIILFQLFDLSLAGYLATGGVAAWVALMAILQLKGLSKVAA